MALFGDGKKSISDLTVKNPRDMFNEVLKFTSGATIVRELPYEIFYQVIAFKGVVEGVGCSTIVANTALAIAEAGLNVCVIDTSILHPVQDILLNTNVESSDLNNRLDWFDMPFTKKSPLHSSRINGRVSVLSFAGKKRTIVDFLSTNDATELVEIALAELHNKFDIILIDSCDEVTSVNFGALQQAQTVIQVWTDTPQVTRNIDNYITNCITSSIPLDKMRYVVMNMVTPDLIGSNSEDILKQYRLNCLGRMNFSTEVRRNVTMGYPLWQLESTDKDIASFTELIIKIACHILNVNKGKHDAKGSFTANDVDAGKVKGTLKYKNKHKDDEGAPAIATTIEGAEAQLGTPDYVVSFVDGDRKVASAVSRVGGASNPQSLFDDEPDFDEAVDTGFSMDDDVKHAKEEASSAFSGIVKPEEVQRSEDKFADLYATETTSETKKKKGLFGKKK